MTDAAGPEKLARVSYLPGVVPPTQPEVLRDPEPAAFIAEETAPQRRPQFESRLQFKGSSRPERSVQSKSSVQSESSVHPENSVQPERSARAHNVSMNALARRGVSSAEMVDLLRRRELSEDDIHLEVQRLEEVGLLSDRDLAENLVRTLRERKGLGRSAITAELRRRKVDGIAIEEVMAALDENDETGDAELTRAREIALKRAPQLRSLDPETARRRLGAFLMRKGYSGSIVASAVQSALASGASTPRGPRFE